MVPLRAGPILGEEHRYERDKRDDATYLVVKLVEQVAARTVTVSLTVLPETAVPILNWTDPFPAPSVVPVYVNVVVL